MFSKDSWRLMLAVMACLVIAFVLAGCAGDDGAQGPPGNDGADGQDGEDGAGTVPIRVLDVFGAGASSGVTVYARFVGPPPDYEAVPAQAVAPAQAVPMATGDFEFVLPPGYYTIWLEREIAGHTYEDQTQGQMNNVLITLGQNSTKTLYAPTRLNPTNDVDNYDSNGPISGGRNTISGTSTWAWWKFEVRDPRSNETWIYSTMTAASGTPQITMVASWLRSNYDFGTQDGTFTFNVNTSNDEVLGGHMPANGGGDDTGKVGISIGGVAAQPNVLADDNDLYLIQARGDLNELI